MLAMSEKEDTATTRRLVFEYSSEDVTSCNNRDSGLNDTHLPTEFDQLLLGRWEEAMRGGVFRYDLGEVVSRSVPGCYGFVVLNNPKRFSHRRPPGDMQTLVQPFDHSQFNFNRCTDKEILFEVRRKGSKEDVPEERRHIVVVNVSPIDKGHVLLVPEPASCFPQVMTESSLQLCLELVSLSGHRGFCMVANSLLAYASVNHLHYHFMYMDYPHLPAMATRGKEVDGCRGCFQLDGHYVRGFGFQLDSDSQSCAQAIFRVVELLLENGIPHNLTMLRGPPFSVTTATTDHLPPPPPTPPPTFVRTILIPRKPVLGFKQLYHQNESGPPPPFFAASCELALGLIPIMDKEKYATMSEEEIVSRLREQELSEEEFSKIVDKLCDRIKSNIIS